MTGPEHYREAEQLASASVYAYQKWGESGKTDELKSARWQQAQGQLHATLALAAATVRLRTPTAGSWDEVLR